MSEIEVPGADVLCDCCRLSLRAWTFRSDFKAAGIKLRLCPACAAIHAPMLHAITRQTRLRQVGVD